MPPSDEDFERALVALLEGDVIGLPTETVYGLAADGTNPTAVRKIFSIKGRPVSHPLILHLGDVSWLSRYAIDVPDVAYWLAEAFWPGPLTLVLRRGPNVPDEVTAGLSTVAVRVPKHLVALDALRRLNRPLAAPSANRFGEVSPTTHEHVVRDLGDDVRVVLDGGPCEIGVESTIVNLTSDRPAILRPGQITAADIEAVSGAPLSESEGRGPAAPGTLEAHYAPRARVVVVRREELWSRVEASLRAKERVGVFSALEPPAPLTDRIEFRKMGSSVAAAHDLYRVLRDLDDLGTETVFATAPPAEGIGMAVVDRLRRAERGSRS